MLRLIRTHFASFAAIILLIAALGGIVYSYKQSMKELKEIDILKQSGAAPSALLEVTDFDWGEIGLDKVVSQDFVIKNPSSNPLTIKEIATSCGCTTAVLALNGIEAELPAKMPAGSEGIIHVEFDPALHEARGDTKRAVRIETNDPNNPFLVINLRAYVR